MTYRNVLVTGASGFVGRAVCEHLVRRGHTVSGAARDPEAVSPLVRPRRIGNIGPDTDWVDALFNIDAVVHLAARVHVMHETSENAITSYRTVNTEGTLHLAEAAAAAGVKRFVFISTIKVNGERTHRRPFTEMDPPMPEDPYAVSKWEAEQALWQVARAFGMEVVVLRPPLVYGPGVKGNFRSLLDLLDYRLPLPFGMIHNRRSLIYVETLASAITVCLEHPLAAGETFLVKDSENLSTASLIRHIDRAAGRRSRLLPVPVFLLRLFGLLIGKGKAIARLTDSLAIDDTYIRETLDWHPGAAAGLGLEETVLWHKKLIETPIEPDSGPKAKPPKKDPSR